MPSKFAQLGVPQSICAALERRGITEPFEIQAATIADALGGRDVCGRAPTGSGKTLAFGIPLVATVERAEPRRPGALVLAPTRELADQISTELRGFAGPIRLGVVYGGVGYGPQIQALRRGVDILVACPGRLEDLIARGDVDLSAVERVVLDEADRMADMGFMPAVRRLLDQTSDQRQTLLFSATLDGDVARLTRDYQRNPVRHEVGESTPDITSAHHLFWNVSRHDRVATTAKAIDAAWPAIVFCRTRHGSDRVARQLSRDGIRAVALHGGRSQPQRTRALADFAGGRVHALIATDVAARGIHVEGVASVIHFDPPEDHKAYVHRSGRTARAGQGGVVVSLVQPEQVKDIRRIQRQAGMEELFTDPDAVALRRLSPPPARAATPATNAGDTVESQRADSSSPRRSSGSRRRPSHGRSSAGHSKGRPKAKNSQNGKPQSGKPAQNAKKPRSDKKPQNAKQTQNAKQAQNGKQAQGSKKTGPKRNTGRGSSAKTHSGPNRKARRAHLQPGVNA